MASHLLTVIDIAYSKKLAAEGVVRTEAMVETMDILEMHTVAVKAQDDSMEPPREIVEPRREPVGLRFVAAADGRLPQKRS